MRKRDGVVVAAVLAVFAVPAAGAKEDGVWTKLEALSKVLSYVETNYVEAPDSAKLVENAIKGLLSDLDPHTVYMPPDLFREIKLDTTGEFGGLGLEISVKDDVLTVVAPIEDTPASEAGIRPGDKILKIDGAPTTGMTLFEAVEKMRGPHGSKVTLTLAREGTPEPFEVTLRRGTIHIQSVDSELIEGRYGYVRLKNFQQKTERELKRRLDKLEKAAGGNLKGLILDLRNNPGGLLEQAVRVADVWLDSGSIVSTRGRAGSFQEVELAHKEDTRPYLPMITLVNEGTASASEIVAGALQDHKRSVILGSATFGKGSVQTIIDLGDGSGLKLTIAQYYTPHGHSIQALGITPDIPVSPLPVETAGVEHVREKHLKGHFEASKDEAAERAKEAKKKPRGGITDLEGDLQLARALEYLKTWEVFQSAVGDKQPKG